MLSHALQSTLLIAERVCINMVLTSQHEQAQSPRAKDVLTCQVLQCYLLHWTWLTSELELLACTLQKMLRHGPSSIRLHGCSL